MVHLPLLAASGECLRVTTSYEHLGRLLTEQLSDLKDLRALAAISRQSALRLNKLLRNRAFPTNLKVQLVSCLATSKLTSGIHSSMTWNARERQTFGRAYYDLIRLATNQHGFSEEKMTDLEVARLAELPSAQP
eukprot:3757068-Amphidinium_carterae.2